MKNDYIFKTRRLGFRFLRKDDVGYIEDLEGDSDVTHFVGGVLNKGEVATMVDQFLARYQKTGLPHFLIFELNSGKFVGRCGFRPTDSGEVEVGYGFHKKFWGQGFATETLEALFSFARRNISVDHIIAFTSVNHLASQRVMEKCGMQYIKTEICEGEECKFYKKELIDHPKSE